MNLWTFLADAARLRPEHPALLQDHRTLTYRDAAALAGTLATNLQHRGIDRGRHVAVLLPNTIDHALAYFALAGAAMPLVSLNYRLSPGELRAILAHSGAGAVLHDASTAALAAEIAAVTPLGAIDVDELFAPPGEPFVPEPVEPGAIAQLYYTSGTTGQPKGVVLTHGNVGTHARAAARELQLAAEDRWAHIAPMFHLADAWATFAITLAGGTHVFLPHFTAVAALDLLAGQRITITNLVPTMLNLMVKEPGAGDRSYALRAMLSGGAPIAPATVRAILATFRCDYVQTYGMTETSPYLTLSLPTEAVRRLPAEEQLRMKCRTGRPFLGVELKVVDEQGRPVPADDATVGEIRVRGATVTPGYYRDPAATAAAFDEQGFLRTGDLATVDRYGYVDIKDRSKDAIKTGGETVFSIEVENVLYQHPAVLECAVFGVADAVWGEAVTAAVVLRPGTTATGPELIAFCRERIAHYKAPRAVRFLTALPKTGSGKIQKRRLREAGPSA